MSPCVKSFFSVQDHRKNIVLFRMSHHISSNSLLNPFQSAYKPGHSTETALLKFVNDLLLSLDKGNISIVTSLDLSAAFDTIDDSILLSRLEHVFGIHGTALQLFSSYPSSRTQTISINNLEFDPAPVSFDGPQDCTAMVLLITRPAELKLSPSTT